MEYVNQKHGACAPCAIIPEMKQEEAMITASKFKQAFQAAGIPFVTLASEIRKDGMLV